MRNRALDRLWLVASVQSGERFVLIFRPDQLGPALDAAWKWKRQLAVTEPGRWRLYLEMIDLIEALVLEYHKQIANEVIDGSDRTKGAQ